MSDPGHIILTSHRPSGERHHTLNWGAATARERGPIVGGLANPATRNVIGTHSGSYGVYRALAVATGSLDPIHRPDLTNTEPTEDIGPFEQWADPAKIVSIDPYGHKVAEEFADDIGNGVGIQPTIAVTKARINLGELRDAVATGRLSADGDVLLENGDVNVTKAAIEPVWYLPGIAERLELKEPELRRTLFEQTGGMFPELVTRSDLKVFLPPIGGMTLYAFGDVTALWDPDRNLACRVHDECNGSDVFGSDICTCRPYLTHGIEECIRMAQDGGAGLIVYNRKEGRALGEVTKFLVYNARKRQPLGDSAATYFERTECVAGVQDNRFQDLMPDVFHWLGITRIDRFMSMSDMKFGALAKQGIEVVERVPIPDELIPLDAHVEMDAKKAAGYFVDETVTAPTELEKTKGRPLDDY